jgi:hypothetical protein
MFGWDFQNSKSDRIKLFLFLLVLFLVVGFTASTLLRSLNDETADARDQKTESTEESYLTADSPNQSNSESKSEEEKVNEYDQTEHFSSEELEDTKEIAVQFVTAFHTYNADKPTDYLEQAKPYMTEALYEKMNRNGRREVLERSYLTVKETDVTSVNRRLVPSRVARCGGRMESRGCESECPNLMILTAMRLMAVLL